MLLYMYLIMQGQQNRGRGGAEGLQPPQYQKRLGSAPPICLISLNNDSLPVKYFSVILVASIIQNKQSETTN